MLAQLSMIIRNGAAESIESIDLNLPLILSLIKIPNLLKEENQNSSIKDLRIDITHLLNIGRVPWLSSLHNSIVKTDTIKELKRFSEKLYELSRDPRKEFLWTMILVARANNSTELENASNSYSVLTSSLLTLTGKLEELGYSDFIDEINEVAEIKALDALADISELYKPRNIDPTRLENAIRLKVKELIAISLDLIAIQEVRETLFQILQFTTIDGNLTTIEELGEYLINLGN
jgi:methyl coenzyme M reductase subunit C-like uncharacterized protein (methanogenesis marker protein 7)